MRRILLFAAAALLCAAPACQKSSETASTPGVTRIVLNVATEMTTRGAASDEENRVDAIDLYVFDAESGLLEKNLSGIVPTATGTAAAGRLPLGEVDVELPDTKPKNILAIANLTEDNALLPTLAEGTTTYAQMLAATAVLSTGAQPKAPLLMCGYANDVTANATAAVVLSRRMAKFAVKNREESGELRISSLNFLQASGSFCLFQKSCGEDGPRYVDYAPACVELGKGASANFYLLPQTAADNRTVLRIEGTLAGTPFTQELEIRPLDEQGKEADIEANSLYTVVLTAEARTVKLNVSLQPSADWNDACEIVGVIPGIDTPAETISFNGLEWMAANLGATAADPQTDWQNTRGDFYQWGRNVAFTPGSYDTASGPLSAEEAASETNASSFITKMSGDWLSPSDDSLWATADRQPCPEGYRMPTYEELFGIFSSSGVLFNMYNGPKIVTDEPLPGGAATAHYFGDNSNKTLYGIKRQGTDEAYYLKWEYLKTPSGDAYARISRWDADATATFSSQDLAAVRERFDALGQAPQTIHFAASGYLTGSNGNYSDSKGGYYWSSSPNGAGAWRAEFTDGKMVMTNPYNSRVSGHSIRCVKM